MQFLVMHLLFNTNDFLQATSFLRVPLRGTRYKRTPAERVSSASHHDSHLILNELKSLSPAVVIQLHRVHAIRHALKRDAQCHVWKL